MDIILKSSALVEGLNLVLINDLDIADNGDIYFSQSSTDVSLNFGMFIMLASGSGR
jgi:hypothetical protein